ncbi:MAG: DnaD domain protein [Abiotrophia defectiva]|uniref:DnaD domain protein n=1 Tax=Abiotrophia defectiva TaxID=46125 RepID=A0A929MNL4_ABIDE|nr:DnaD domain protein [Abiotrophia defectiva]
MSLKRVVDTRFWNQVDVMERYSSQDKLFALYLMTCPRSTQLGIYSLPKRVIAFDMSLDDAQVGQLLARFQDDYQVIAYSDQTQEVAILDFLTYSLVKGGQPVERLLRNQAEDVRDSQLLVKVFQHLASYYEHSHRLIDQLSQEVLATELKRRQELGSEGEGVSPLSQGTQLGSLSQETHEASTRLGSSDNHNQNPNQKDNQIHKENQSHNHKQNQNHNSASKLAADSEGKSLASQLMTNPALTKGRDRESALSLSMISLDSAASTQPFGQAISLPSQSASQLLTQAQSLTSKPGQSQAGISQQTMDQFVRVERDMAKLRPFYERYFGPMSGAESLQFRNWLDKIGYLPVIEAIEQAHRRQAKKPFAYISTICQQASKS